LVKSTDLISNKVVPSFGLKSFVKDLKKVVNDGEVKNKLSSPLNYDYTTNINLDFEGLVNNYKKGNVFFKKNEKQAIKTLEDLGSGVNL